MQLDDKLREMDREITVNPLYIQKVLLVTFHLLHVSCGYGTLLYGCKQPTCDIARMCRVLDFTMTMCLDRASFLLTALCNTIFIQRITSYNYKIVCVGVSQMLVSKICKRVAERVHN